MAGQCCQYTNVCTHETFFHHFFCLIRRRNVCNSRRLKFEISYRSAVDMASGGTEPMDVYNRNDDCSLLDSDDDAWGQLHYDCECFHYTSIVVHVVLFFDLIFVLFYIQGPSGTVDEVRQRLDSLTTSSDRTTNCNPTTLSGNCQHLATQALVQWDTQTGAIHFAIPLLHPPLLLTPAVTPSGGSSGAGGSSSRTGGRSVGTPYGHNRDN